MYPETHFLFAYAIALFLVKLNYISLNQAFIIAVIAVIIDIDHYIDYIIKTKNFNLKQAFNIASNNDYKNIKFGKTFIHYKSGIFLISSFILISYFFGYFNLSLILIISYFSHIFLDFYYNKFLEKSNKYISYQILSLEFKKTYDEAILNIILIIFILIFLFY